MKVAGFSFLNWNSLSTLSSTIIVITITMGISSFILWRWLRKRPLDERVDLRF